MLEGEEGTSITCSRCGKADHRSRMYRGLFICRYCGFKMNADINAALNIMKLVYGKIPEKLNKTKTFITTHNGVKPITPTQRGNPNRPLG